jgi:hypothetical protein
MISDFKTIWHAHLMGVQATILEDLKQTINYQFVARATNDRSSL